MSQSKKPGVAGPQLMCIASPATGSGKAVVWLHGDHGLPTADSLSTALASASAYGSDIAVDLSGVEFMDSTTLHAILRAKVTAEAQGRAVTVRKPSPAARLVLGMCGFDHLVEPEPGGAGPGEPAPVAPSWPDEAEGHAAPAAAAQEGGAARPPPGNGQS